MILSPAQIQAYAAAAGFDDPATATAIALAESNGNANSYNPETAAGAPSGKGSYGLWQIYLNAHPEDAGLNLFDPSTNAAAAFAVYSQQGWGAWSTYNSGKYLAYMPASSPAPADTPAISAVDDSGVVMVNDTDTGDNTLLYAGMALAALLGIAWWNE